MQADATIQRDCPGCGASVGLSPGEVERIITDYFRGRPQSMVDDPTYNWRLSKCRSCRDLQYGTTCRHCGCLVAVRAKLTDKACPAPMPKW
jgi:hypothetical protein